MKSLIAIILTLLCVGCSARNEGAPDEQKGMAAEPFKAESHTVELVNDSFISSVNMP